MTQLSRPFQILLVAFVLFAAVWFVALRGHNGAPGSPSASSSPSASHAGSTPVAPGKATNPASPTRVYHGPVPGLQGLTHAINKAHGAVAESQADAKSFEHAEPSGASSSSSTGQGSAASAHPGTGSAAAAASATAAATHAQAGAHPGGSAAGAKTAVASGPAMQATVERELAHNRTVLVLFWNPKGSEDRAVRAQLPAVAHKLGATVAVHYSLPHAVAQYGKFTNTVQVNQTPTILLVNPHGQATALTGFLDAYAIDQAVAEARAS
jgi:hypothetical protein